MKIAVFMGGTSSEREISLKTGKAILNSLINQGYDAYGVDLTKENLISAFLENQYDLAYLALHGEFGEDGKIQGFLDMLGKKYTGSRALGSAITMDKEYTKSIVKNEGIRIPKTYKEIQEIEEFPVVIKPAAEGSSVGLYICHNLEEALIAQEKLNGKKIVIEEFVQGDELTVGVMNGEGLGVIRIKPKSGLYDFDSKYTVGYTEYEYPAQISEELYKEVMEKAEKVHKILGLSGITRSDFLLKDGKLYFLEVNTTPGMTETSLIPKAASLKGYSFDDLTKTMVETFK